MHWEEKIDKLKEKTSPGDFKIPFTAWFGILTKIEDKFVFKENSQCIFSNWDNRLKQKKRIKTIPTVNIDSELSKFDSNKNYWVVLTTSRADFKSLVYDCKPTAIKLVIALWNGDFCIIDKKYHWLIFFKRNNPNTEIFKSGGFVTPLDNK